MLLEDKRTFPKVVKATITEPNSRSYNRLVSAYQKIENRSENKLIVEKSHPNLWIAEKLILDFPEAHFVGIQRDVYQVVYSILNHNGVLKWFEVLPNDKLSPFLGINEGNISY